MGPGHADAALPSDAEATIARQEAEIERLRRRVTDDRFAHDLRDALTTASATGTIGTLVTHTGLLKMIVVAGADIIDAKAASLFLIDAEQQNLVFEMALDDEVAEARGPDPRSTFSIDCQEGLGPWRSWPRRPRRPRG
jgi:hypothetical protein